MSAIEVRGVTKTYETGGQSVTALDDVDFAVEAGEFVSVMGPSGSGKSTLLNVVGLLDEPSAGSVRLGGKPVTDLSDRELTIERRRSIGFVFQNFHLIPSLTAVENVEVPALFRSSAQNPTDRAVGLLERVGLGDRLDHLPEQLSGGQQQRVAIARALINDPHILLADEPTGNLDRDTGETILSEFARIAREENVAIVTVTHDEQVNRYADRVVRIVDGRVQS